LRNGSFLFCLGAVPFWLSGWVSCWVWVTGLCWIFREFSVVWIVKDFWVLDN
jgi:hypothetical protein